MEIDQSLCNDMPKKIIIEVRGGCVIAVWTDITEKVMARLIDWDNLAEESLPTRRDAREIIKEANEYYTQIL